MQCLFEHHPKFYAHSLSRVFFVFKKYILAEMDAFSSPLRRHISLSYIATAYCKSTEEQKVWLNVIFKPAEETFKGGWHSPRALQLLSLAVSLACVAVALNLLGRLQRRLQFPMPRLTKSSHTIDSGLAAESVSLQQ